MYQSICAPTSWNKTILEILSTFKSNNVILTSLEHESYLNKLYENNHFSNRLIIQHSYVSPHDSQTSITNYSITSFINKRNISFNIKSFNIISKIRRKLPKNKITTRKKCKSYSTPRASNWTREFSASSYKYHQLFLVS